MGGCFVGVFGSFGDGYSLVQSFRRNWEMISEAFKTGGIIAGLKAIGATILDALLMPLQKILEIASKIPGVGKFAASAASKLADFREGLGVNVTTDESGKPLASPLNAEASAERIRTERIERTQNSKAELVIKDETERAELQGELGTNIKLSPTIG